MKNVYLNLIIIIATLYINCDKENPIEKMNTTSTIKDVDGNVYKIVQIGNQWWMSENLKVTRYRNGDQIPNITDSTYWYNLRTGAYCNYNNNELSVSIYGRLYNWYAVNDSRNIAPEGWHVPSFEEWGILCNFLGIDVAGGKLKETGTTHWNSPNTGATNESGFTALPGGYRFSPNDYYNAGKYAMFWTSFEIDSNYASYYGLSYNSASIFSNYYSKKNAYSVRCIRD